jgi:outer membrane protein assembly factor BamD (BamD/ComL family)
MHKRLLLYFFIGISLIIASCNNVDYQKTLAEKQELERQLEEEKYGASKLLKEAKIFMEAGDIAKAEEKLNLLFSKHGDKPEAIEGKSIMTKVEEIKKVETENNIWNNASTSENVFAIQQYLYQYPEGKYANQAHSKLKELKAKQEAMDYESALASNSSSTWKDFLIKYPNRSDESNIKKKIIQAEVEEIMQNRETGELPSFNRTNFEYSSISSVNITNDTNCELTVRYSGEDVKIIEIPAGATRSVSLSSGSYKIAASACGASYAGIENLGGSYSCKYYIVTRTY